MESLPDTLRQLADLFKLRIGVVMMFTALAAAAISPGPPLNGWEMLVLAAAVLVSAASAGAFNQYYEVDLDRTMRRTSRRAFVTGRYQPNGAWGLLIVGLLTAGVAAAAVVLNLATACYVFLGAFFYAVVYTVWLKRRTWMNIVIGGASGSFAVLAGAAAVDPALGPVPVLLALVLFFWTPSHFWSLAIAQHEDYAKAGVPMLPVVVGDRRAAEMVLGNTLILVGVSILPVFYGMHWIYLIGALAGGGYFLYRNLLMVRDPSPRVAIRSFLASLVQLVVLLVAAVLDSVLLG